MAKPVTFSGDKPAAKENPWAIFADDYGPNGTKKSSGGKKSGGKKGSKGGGS